MTNGSHLHISNLSEPIKLFIPIKESKETETAQDHYFVNSSVIRYHKVKLRSALETVFVKIIPDKDALLDIFVSAGVKPNSENYTFTRRIPDDSDNTSCRFIYPGTGFINCAINPYMFSFSSNSTGDHFIGIRLVYGRTKPVLKSFVKSHVRRKRWWITVKDPPTTPISTRRVVPKYDSKTDVNYSMSVKIGTCLYWAENKQDWTSEGCKVSLLQLTPDNSNQNRFPPDFHYTFIVILPSVTRTLDNSNLPLTRSNFCFPSDHFNIILPSLTRTKF